jgi:hypothetical protein
MSPFYVGADKTLVDSLIVQARDYTNWMSDESSGSSNINNFFGRDSPANQLMSAAGYLQMAGQLHGDPAIVDQAKRRMQQIFDNNVGNDPSNILQYGVFYEKVTKDGIGFDASYMGFSLQNLANHVWLEPAGPQQDLYLQKLELGVRRFLKAIDIPTGTISTKLFFNPPNLPLSSVWTRVLETFPAKPGIFAKGWNWDCFSLRAQIFNFYLPSVVPSGLANLMTNQGRSFGHIAGDIADPQLYIVLTQAQINTVKGLSPDVDWAALIQAQRVGGGSFPSYPGGVAPNPCFILPTSVESQSVHASHKTFLGTLPHIDKLAPGFPAGI